ncbi:unnamed protein product [Caenorhabditis angaria]|uniref:Metallo-beta-lactamase domain-containing protein n=1 Tax=Caenorhabditis angaria TaxID=860376 RepID=A0A9P1MZW2_9PELO|nr:unnamed protein product [Caenorhabditis angaria]
MKHLFIFAIFSAVAISESNAATTEQLRQWILNNRESLSGQSDLAGSILRLFGWGTDRQSEVQKLLTTDPVTTTTTTTTPQPTPKSANRDVCPFAADPLILANDFAYCRPASLGDCPVGYLCDQSFKLGRSICCKDTRQGLVPNGRPARPSSRLPLSWSTVTPTSAPSQPIVTATSRKAPWYIKDRTSWPTVYNRVAAEKALQKTSSTSTTTTTTTTTEEPTTSTQPSTTTTEATTTTEEPTTTTTTTEVPTTTTEEPTTTTETPTTTTKVNAWARLWTSTASPKNTVNVTVLQAGSVRPLRDGQAETVGAITLVNDNGYILLVDTGSSSDTERLLHMQFLQHNGFNFIATAAVSSIGVLYSVHVLCILASWYGLIRQKSSWLVPKIVLKATTVVICMVLTLILAFFVSSNSPKIGNFIAEGFNAEYYDHRAVIDMACLVIVGISAILSMAQAWLLVLLINIYRQIRAQELERLSLAKESVTLDQVDSVVITHASPGHMGNMNFFAQKPILYHSLEYIGRHVTPTELKERPYRKLSSNIEVWKTPGHTQHDLSVLVHNVAGYGTMAVVGDLIPSEHLLSEKRDVMHEEGVWDSAIKRQNANLIVCMADWIVPGHGQPFRVLPNYRQKAGCTRLLAQRHLLNQV